MSNIIISINPQHVDNILAGKKKFEYRKSVPLDLRFMLIYATAPIKRVVALCEVDHIVCDTPYNVWMSTHEDGCISRDFFNMYYANSNLAFAIRIKSIYTFKPIKINRFGLTRPPQSWQYLRLKLHDYTDKVTFLNLIQHL